MSDRLSTARTQSEPTRLSILLRRHAVLAFSKRAARRYCIIGDGFLVEHHRDPVRADQMEQFTNLVSLAVNRRVARRHCTIGDGFLVEHHRHPVRDNRTEYFMRVVFRFGIQQKGCKKVLQYWLSSLFQRSRQTIVAQRDFSRTTSRDLIAENLDTLLSDVLVVQRINIDQRALFQKKPVLQSQQT